MKVILFGASGMVGQGVLRECLSEAEYTRITYDFTLRAAEHLLDPADINALAEVSG